jgi:hypothetical protein
MSNDGMVLAVPVGVGQTRRTGNRDEAKAQYEVAPPGVRGLDFAREVILQRASDIVRMTYPRIYERAEAYHSPRDVGTMLALSVFTPHVLGIAYTPTTYRLMAPSIGPLIERRVPLMFVSPRLLDAVMRTDFKDPIDWRNMHLPYEEGIFVMPRGGASAASTSHPTDGEIGFLYYGRQKPGPHKFPVHFPDEEPGEPQTVFVNDHRFTFAAACPESPLLTWYDSNITMTERPLINYNQMFYDADGKYIERKIANTWDAPLDKVDAPFLEMVGRLVFGLLLALTARPELIGREKHLRTIPARRDKPAREFWSPLILGENYQQPQRREHQGGTHASPRWHSRRGHFRNQACGPNRTERRVIWIEPTMVMAGVEHE